MNLAESERQGYTWKIRLAILIFASCSALPAQVLVEPERTAAARVEFASASSAPRMLCQIQPILPALSYRLQFEAGYDVVLPLGEFDRVHQLGILLRVSPEGRDPVYLTLARTAPRNSKPANVGFTGMFAVGDGSYGVEVLAKDESGRVCSGHWRIQAKLTAHERDIGSPIPSREVRAFSADVVPPPAPAIERFTILVHAAPANPRATEIEPETIRTITESLQALLTHLPAKSVRVAVFNLDQHLVLMNQRPFSIGDIAAVKDTIGKLNLGVVSLKTLEDRANSDVLVDLLRDPEPGSAVIVLGPATIWSTEVALQRPPGVLWYYLEYVALPTHQALRTMGGMSPGDVIMRKIQLEGLSYDGHLDGVDRMVRRAGGVTLPIHSPHDLAEAIHRLAWDRPSSLSGLSTPTGPLTGHKLP
jgi:hypothetical protein